MKVKYRNTDATTIEVDVPEEVALALEASYRSEDNSTRKWQRHHCSLDFLKLERKEYVDLDTPETLLLEAESNDRCNAALAQLTDIQRRRFIMYSSGLSTYEIARREGCVHQSVHESIIAAQIKLKKFF